MKVWLLCVGRADRLIAPVIEEFEARAARYWPLEFVEVKAEGGKRSPSEVRDAEAERLLARLPADAQVIALTRVGTRWSSAELARRIQNLGLRSHAGPAFVIGGAYGLGPALLERADHRLSLSDFTMPHDVARLVLTEQLYRAGTIVRNEPYHKG